DLVRVMENERLLISQLVRIAQSALTASATWEALQAEGWTDAQLMQLQERWASQEFIKPFVAALTMERAMALNVILRSRESSAYRHDYFSQSSPDVEDVLQRPVQLLEDQLEALLWPAFLSYRFERER